MKNRHVKTTASIGLALAGFMMGPSIRADQELDAPILLPIKMKASVDAKSDSSGSEITMNSNIELGACKARLTFKRNHKARRSMVVVGEFDLDLITKGTAYSTNISLPKQPQDGGVGGNPLVYFQLHDGKGNNLTDEVLLGREVQGLSVSADLIADALLHAKVQADGCSSPKGPNINLDCDITLTGLHARYVFRNNEKGTHSVELDRDIVIIMDGSKITVPKKPRRKGLGSNPVIYIQILDENDQPLGHQVRLGRCSDL